MTTPLRLRAVIHALVLFSLLAGVGRGAAAHDPLLGRWALTIPGGAAGWLEVKEEGGALRGSILWGGGSVLPVSSIRIQDGLLIVTRVRDVQRADGRGKMLTEKITETITGQATGDNLRLARTAPRPGGGGTEWAEFSGRRIPPVPSKPDLAKVKWGEPIQLLNGRDLSGWRLIEGDTENGWSVQNGQLANRPAPVAAGQPRRRFGNLRTDREFEDFNLKLDVNVPTGSNSGVYLRGIYEVQVADSFGKPLDSHNMGALYSRLTPTAAAEKRPGEWQSPGVQEGR